MSFDRADYDQFLAEQKDNPSRPNLRALEALQQAAVAAEHLTGDRNWSVYQQLLQAQLERTEGVKEACLRQLQDPLTVDHDTIIRTKIQLAEAQGVMNALEAAIALPKQVMEQGEKAGEILSERLSLDDSQAA